MPYYNSQTLLPAVENSQNAVFVESSPPPYQVGRVARWNVSQAEWQAENVPSVSAVSGRLALHRAGLLPQVKAVIQAAGEEAEVWFEFAITWDRAHPLVQQLVAAIGLSEEDADALFFEADLFAG